MYQLSAQQLSFCKVSGCILILLAGRNANKKNLSVLRTYLKGTNQHVSHLSQQNVFTVRADVNTRLSINTVWCQVKMRFSRQQYGEKAAEWDSSHQQPLVGWSNHLLLQLPPFLSEVGLVGALSKGNLQRISKRKHSRIYSHIAILLSKLGRKFDTPVEQPHTFGFMLI